jgi:photosystem II stability/assembly factor-like uncharacterized protein
MNDKIFLAVFNEGISRAECGSNGEWITEKVASEHKVTCLTADPANPNVVYAGTPDSVLRSDDFGRTWHKSGGTLGEHVKSLAVSPHDSNIVYAGTKPAHMHISEDGGRSWAELDGFRRIPFRWWWFSPAELPDRRPYIISIAPSPVDPNVILAGIELGAVVRSENGGRNWSGHRKGALRDCHSLKFHAANGDWAYQAGGTGGGAAFSRDGGQTFHKAKHGLAKNYGIVCAADSEEPEIWYICVAPGPMNAFGKEPEIYLYRATGGAGWKPIGWQLHPLPISPTALSTIPGQPGHLYAGLYNGDIWHSADHGDNWTQMPFTFEGIWYSLLIV